MVSRTHTLYLPELLSLDCHLQYFGAQNRSIVINLYKFGDNGLETLLMMDVSSNTKGLASKSAELVFFVKILFIRAKF